MHRGRGEDVQMGVGGHLCIGQQLGLLGEAPKGHEVHKHAVVFLVPKHHLIV